MFLDQDVYSFDECWLNRIRGIVGDETEEKKALFNRFARDLEQIRITKLPLEKRIKKLNKISDLLELLSFICFIILLLNLKSENNWLSLLALIFLLCAFIQLDIRDKIYELEHTDPMSSGYYSEDDVYAMNKYLSDALVDKEIVCNAKRELKRGPQLGLTAYYADLENLHLDVSECIRPGSPDEVPVTFAIGINLIRRTDKIDLKSLDKSLMVNVVYFCIPENSRYRVESIAQKK